MTDFDPEKALAALPAPDIAGIARDVAGQKGAVERLATQYLVTRELSQARTLSDAIPKVLEVMCESLRGQWGALWDLDGRENVLRCAHVWSSPSVDLQGFERDSRQMTFPPGVGVPGRVWAGGRPVWIDYVQQDANFPRRAAAAEAGLHGALGFPVAVGSETLGVLEFLRRETREPDEDTLRALAGIGGQIGQFIHRKRAEEALGESEARKRAILEAALDCIITIDAEGKVLEWNPAAEKTFGYRREEVLGRDMAELIIPPALRASHRRGLARCLASGEGPVLGKRVEMPGVRADGTEFPAELAITRIATRGPPEFTAYLRDVTEREQSEQARSYLAAIVESSGDAILGKTLDGTIVSWNRGAETLYGYPAGEVVGRPVSLLVPPEHGGELPEIMGRLRRGESIDHFETVRVRKDGSRVEVSLNISPVLDGGGRVIGASSIARDITDRKQAEEALRRLNEELEQRVWARTVQLEAANKELEAFSYSVSHDLRAPLRAIDGFSRILLEDHAPRLPAEARRLLERVRHNTLQMGRLVDDLLTLARLGRQPLGKQPVAPARLVEQVLGELAGEREGRRVDVRVADLPECRADPALLKQVWVNLLSNALKYTRGRDEARVEVGCRAGCGAPVYFVRDNGAGFDMRYAHKLFGVFQRLHRAEEYEGTGVGLAIVQRIVHRHGGRAWAEGKPGEGATFYFTLEAGAP
jgi:PAS domain S-box-containing protein